MPNYFCGPLQMKISTFCGPLPMKIFKVAPAFGG